MIKNSKFIATTPLPTNYQIMQSMRSTMLQIQYLTHYLDQQIASQNSNIERQIKDRLLQLLQIYEKHSSLQLSNTTKYLILQLEQILTLQDPMINQVWTLLDDFVKYLKELKSMVSNFTRKIYFGRNIGVDVEKLNVLVKKTKVYLKTMMEENQEVVEGLKEERELVNKIFERIEEYCQEILGILRFVEANYEKYVEKRVKKQKEITKEQIEEFKEGLMY